MSKLALTNLHTFPRGEQVSTSIATAWLKWQGFAVTIAMLEYHELIRKFATARVQVIWPHTFIENLIALDAEFRLRQCDSFDEGISTI